MGGKFFALFLSLVSEWSKELFFFSDSQFPLLCAGYHWGMRKVAVGEAHSVLSTPQQHHVTTKMGIWMCPRTLGTFLPSTCVSCLQLHDLKWFKRKWPRDGTVPRMVISIRKDLRWKKTAGPASTLGLPPRCWPEILASVHGCRKPAHCMSTVPSRTHRSSAPTRHT